MKNNNQKKNAKNNRLNSLFVPITGAILGAGVILAGVLALKNKTNHKKVHQKIADVKDQATVYVDKVHKKIKDSLKNKKEVI